MYIDIEITIEDKFFAKLAKLAEIEEKNIGEIALSCMFDKCEEKLLEYERRRETNGTREKLDEEIELSEISENRPIQT